MNFIVEHRIKGHYVMETITGVEDIDMLVAMLIQSERFGTSMGDSLRVHSENLRGKRSLLVFTRADRSATVELDEGGILSHVLASITISPTGTAPAGAPATRRP